MGTQSSKQINRVDVYIVHDICCGVGISMEESLHSVCCFFLAKWWKKHIMDKQQRPIMVVKKSHLFAAVQQANILR